MVLDNGYQPNAKRGFIYLFLLVFLLFGFLFSAISITTLILKVNKHPQSEQSITKTITVSQLLSQTDLGAIYQTESLTVTKIKTEKTVAITILLLDAEKNPIPRSVGTVVYQGNTIPLPLTNDSGKAFVTISRNNSTDMKIQITEQQEDFMISENFS